MICLTDRKECEELEADERNIDSKIKKKQEELDRTEKRLKSLENVRPQFMDEVMVFSNYFGFILFFCTDGKFIEFPIFYIWL